MIHLILNKARMRQFIPKGAHEVLILMMTYFLFTSGRCIYAFFTLAYRLLTPVSTPMRIFAKQKHLKSTITLIFKGAQDVVDSQRRAISFSKARMI